MPQHDIYRTSRERNLEISDVVAIGPKESATIRAAASGEGIDVLVSVKTDQNAERSSPSELGTAPVLLSPFRARAAHVVQLGPVRVEQRGPEPAPPLGSHVEAAARRGDREQHSRRVRI
jgi:hypothetical protein